MMLMCLNLMNLDILRHFLGDAIITLEKEKPFRIALFLDDICECVDKRDKVNKQKYPMLRLDDIEDFLFNEMKYSTKVWNMDKIKEILLTLNKNSETVFLKHMNVK